MGKGENVCNQHFLLCPQCFLPVPKQISNFQSHLFCRLQMLSIWTSLKICHLVKSQRMETTELTLYQMTNFRPRPGGSLVSASDS